MKKSKLASFAILAMALAGSAVSAQTVDNWKTPFDVSVKNASGDCWRDANWTPATAAADCDGALVKMTPKAEAAAPADSAAANPVAPAEKAVEHISMRVNADTFFEFDKSVIRSGGKVVLDNMLSEINAHHASHVTIDVVGHTDSKGTETYNKALSVRRAEAVKAYLVSKGIPDTEIQTSGMGKAHPVESNKTAKGRSANRRVEIEAHLEH